MIDERFRQVIERLNMKHILLIVLLGIARISFATQQRPDKLEYENLKLRLETGWGHPSPLQTYFYQNRMEYPFQMISTGNYRGHVASWKIKDGKFYLTEIEIREEKHIPEEYQIKSLNDTIGSENGVFADWFSGVLQCTLLDEQDSYIRASIYFFQVRNGNVIATEKLKDWNDENAGDLTKMNRDYITFYYRLDNDKIVLNGEESLLNTDVSRLSPIFDHYGKSFLDWPYNWENKEKSGAPNCKWLIEKNKLYLTELTVQYGLQFDSIFTDKINLDKEFKTKKSTNKIFADWANGVYLIRHGKLDIDETGYEYFKTEECTFIRVVKGMVKESVTVPGEFNVKNPPDNTDEKLKKLVSDYRNYNN